MIRTYIGLGSNLAHPIQQIKTAIDALKNLPQSHLIATSRLHQTAPVGFLDQPDFINAAVMLDTQLSARNLLMKLQHIEKDQGRIRNHERNRPRTLDLDILLYGDNIIEEPDLTIPHPRLKERAFVLYPLAEIAADLTLPTGERLFDLIQYLKSSD